MQGPRTNAAQWAQAGRDAGKSYASIAETTRKYSPRYDELAEVGLKARSQEKQAAIKAESLARRAEIKAETHLKETEIAVDEFKSINKSKGLIRKAGLVAAAGSAIGLALTPKEERIRPETVDFSKYDEYFEKEQAKDKADLANRFGGGDRTDPDNTDVTYAKRNERGSTSFDPKPAKGGPAGKVTTPSMGGDAWNPLSAVIRYGEGTSGDKGYTTMFGHRQFTDMSRHPNSPMATPWGTQSEAAGAYQFMKPTWDRAKSALNLKDFSPTSQEQAGRWLAEQRGVDLSKRASNLQEFTAIMDKIAPEWASMPASYKGGKSHYGQPSKDLNKLWEIYQSN